MAHRAIEGNPGMKNHWPRWWKTFLFLGLGVLLFHYALWPVAWRWAIAPSVAPEQTGWVVVSRGATGVGETLGQQVGLKGPLRLDRANTSLLAFGVWQAPETGIYRFRLKVADAGILYLNGQPIDYFQSDEVAVRNRGMAYLSPGPCLLTVELRNHQGEGRASVEIKPPGAASYQVLRAEAVHTPMLPHMGLYWRLIRLAENTRPMRVFCVWAALLLWYLTALLGVSPWQVLKGLGKRLKTNPITRFSAGRTTLRLINLWFLVVLAEVALEVLFQLSKHSFLSSLSPLDIAAMAVNTLTMLMAPGVAVLGVLYLVGYAAASRWPGLSSGLQYGALILICFCCLSLALVHVDTWVYGAFEVNLAKTSVPTRFFLLLVMIYLTLLLAWKIGTLGQRQGSRLSWLPLALFGLLLAISLASGLGNYRSYCPTITDQVLADKKIVDLPNIFLISSDGLDLEPMSVYGFGLKTTPNLKRLAASSYVYYAAYANSSATRMSIAALLAGVHPFTNKVMHKYDVLWGQYSLNHLPGILARMGYYCIDISDGYYATPSVFNLRGGFHRENASQRDLRLAGPWWSLRVAFNRSWPLFQSLLARVTHRWVALAGFAEVLQSEKPLVLRKANPNAQECDAPQVASLIKDIRTQSRPIFAHVHLIETHPGVYGCGGYMALRQFSRGTQTRPSQDEFYYDALLNMDAYVGQVIDALRQTGKWKNTLLVFNTDHNRRWSSMYPLPLIVHLPGQVRGYKVTEPVQFIDIAPSIVHYLGLAVPGWMEGQPIFPYGEIAKLGERKIVTFQIEHKQSRPIAFKVITRDTSHTIRLENSRQGDSCPPRSLYAEALPTAEQKQALRDYLFGFMAQRGLERLAQVVRSHQE